MQLKWPMLWDLFSLFPAYAGVILVRGQERHLFFAFPRTRGGDPNGGAGFIIGDAFSPHTRG